MSQERPGFDRNEMSAGRHNKEKLSPEELELQKQREAYENSLLDKVTEEYKAKTGEPPVGMQGEVEFEERVRQDALDEDKERSQNK